VALLLVARDQVVAAGQRLQEARDLLGVVLQVGVEGKHDLSTCLGKARRQRGALAEVSAQLNEGDARRMLGGEGYWPHGVAALRADALARGTLFACVPGELRWDETLAARGTLDAEHTRALWRYCAEGGPENALLCLSYAAHLIGRAEKPAAAHPMPAAGFWPKEPARGQQTIEEA